MRRVLKGAAIVLAVVIVLAVAAVIAARFLIPVDRIKAELTARVKAATGRDLRINGPVSFSLVPNLGVTAKDVAFSNPPGASAKDMATFAALEVSLKVLPLLHKDVEINSLVLVDPVIALEIDKSGHPNWEFSSPAKPAQPAAPAPAKTGGPSLGGLSLNDVRLENGRVSYLDQRSGAKQELSAINMRLSLPSLDGPLAADGSAVWRGETLTLALSLADPRAALDGKDTQAALKLASKPVSFDFKGALAAAPAVKVDGTVNLQIPSVRGLASWAGAPLKLPGSGFGPLAISGKVAMAGNKIAFSDASLALDAIKGKGALALETGGARPALSGRLDLDRLDVNPYLPPPTQGEAKAPVAGGGTGEAPGAAQPSAGWSDAPLDLSALKSADVDFTLTATGLQYRAIQIGNSALALKLKDGRFEADLTQLALYQGTGKGKVVLDGSGAVPGVEADFDLSNVQVEPLLHDAAGFDRLSGSGAFTLNAAGHGRSQRAIIAALNGKGDLHLTNGAIKGLDLIALAKNAAAALQGAQEPTSQTKFTQLSGTYTITNGILHNSDLALTSPELTVTGAGSVNLPDRTVDYRLAPKLGNALKVALLVKGPWDHLSYQPDLSGVANEAAAKLLQKGGKELGKEIKNPDVDTLLKGILGGKK